MKRYGLIIANPGEFGRENYCEGVNKDVSNYENFLRSPVGGAWNKLEINVLNKPSTQDVRIAIEQAKLADYAFIVFAGHGYYSAGKRSTILHLRPGVEIDSAELRQGAKKQTVILDCCRKIERPMLVEKRAALTFAEDATSRMSAANCRKYFDREIESCSESLVVIHSCSIDQTAGDNSERGGHYSYSLIDCTNDWASGLSFDPAHYYSRSIVKAHESAAVHVSRLSGNRQVPQIEKPRSEPYFPFGIVAW
jgi:hypothetical protein